jgi:hypothetical protein
MIPNFKCTKMPSMVYHLMQQSKIIKNLNIIDLNMRKKNYKHSQQHSITILRFNATSTHGV